MTDGPSDSSVVHAPPERIIEEQLDDHLGKIAKNSGGTVLSFFGPLLYGAEEQFRDAAEALAVDSKVKKKLLVILETNGGYIEVVERIAKSLRFHFSNVDFLVPNYAMSAGTVLVMSGDAIHMDYFSILGPIDPQVEGEAGPIPALGYLLQYQRLIEKADQGTLNTAELAFLIQKFDPAALYRYEQARELSISLLKEWLVKYKFKDWSKTESAETNVTRKMKEKRATEIAKQLSDPAEWHSHSRGISMEVLRRDVNLRIEDFGKCTQFRDLIRVYCKLMRDYMVRVGHRSAIHRRGAYVGH